MWQLLKFRIHTSDLFGEGFLCIVILAKMEKNKAIAPKLTVEKGYLTIQVSKVTNAFQLK